MTRRMSAILGEYSPAGQGCTRHFSVPPLEYKNYTSYKKYRPNFGLNIQESYGKRPIEVLGIPTLELRRIQWILLGIWAQYYAHLRIKFYWESEDHENDLD